ncbi:hypothetical protein ABBQ38_015077 [Trebouxia sp. C0009 RCD-2024]
MLHANSVDCLTASLWLARQLPTVWEGATHKTYGLSDRRSTLSMHIQQVLHNQSFRVPWSVVLLLVFVCTHVHSGILGAMSIPSPFHHEAFPEMTGVCEQQLVSWTYA